ncbi:MAG: Na+/H+ antiporter subunit D [Verrucomicrobia bacterium]|nr:Na+/H+ antiporter subunit D [Verrucomicrobiota bacterium]
MNGLLIAPVLLPLLLGILSLLLWHHVRAQRVIAVAGTGLLTLLSLRLLIGIYRHGIQVVHLGNWEAPFGISLAADLLGAIMVVLASITGFAIALYSVGANERQRECFGYYPLVHILIMGVNGAFLTGDIFNLYVWFEVMLMSSFVLLALGGEKPQIEGGVKYMALNFFSSVIFLTAVGLLYGVMGTLNLADLAVKVRGTESTGMLVVIGCLFLASFGIKAAIFPLFFWLPASYHTPPPAVSGLFAGLLTKVGVYAMIRLFTLIFTPDLVHLHGLILGLAALTMVTGVLGAAAQFEFRRILSFHIVSQIGYMILGLGLFTPLALAGSIFYLMHHIIVKTNLFLIAGIVHYRFGTGELKSLGGLYKTAPWLSLLFLIPALSLAGIPPLSGFFAKLLLVMAAVDIHAWGMIATALGVSLLTLYSMTKIWNEAFWKDAPTPPPPARTDQSTILMMIPVILLATITVVIGFGAGPVFRLALAAANQLMNPSDYIHAVLGVSP